MKRKKINQRKKYQAVLCDVWPYELPIIYSNHGFFRWLQCYKNNEENCLNAQDEEAQMMQALRNVLNGTADRSKLSFTYCIRKGYNKKGNGVKLQRRMLTLPHPIYQMKVALLYNRYSDFLLYQTNRSKFSLRYPYKEAKYQGVQRPMFPQELQWDKKKGKKR